MTVKDSLMIKPEFQKQMIREALELAQAIVEDPTILDQIPNHASIVLIREGDDPEYTEASIAAGLEALRYGRDLYIKHLKADEWLPRASDDSGK